MSHLVNCHSLCFASRRLLRSDGLDSSACLSSQLRFSVSLSLEKRSELELYGLKLNNYTLQAGNIETRNAIKQSVNFMIVMNITVTWFVPCFYNSL